MKKFVQFLYFFVDLRVIFEERFIEFLLLTVLFKIKYKTTFITINCNTKNLLSV